MKSKSECLSYLHTVNIPKLTESEKDSCEGRLTKKRDMGSSEFYGKQ